MSATATVLVFGVFDMLHPGHEFFLNEAGKYGRLYISVAPDEFVRNIKNKNPKHNVEERIEMIKQKFSQAIIYKGDEKIGEWSIFREFIPDVIVLGYDQEMLGDALKKSGIDFSKTEIINLPAFEEDKYKTSLLLGS